jgi:hypothetical protein
MGIGERMKEERKPYRARERERERARGREGERKRDRDSPCAQCVLARYYKMTFAYRRMLCDGGEESVHVECLIFT